MLLAAATAIVAVVLGAAPARAQQGACDRACLTGFVDQYLAALAAHDASKLPLAAGARYTENGQTLKLTEGMWGPAVTVREQRIIAADPVSGQVALLGLVEENRHPAFLALRLRVQGRRIREMEAIVARTAAGGFAQPEGFKPHPIFSETLAPAERRPRAELVRVANSYFEGLEQETGRLTPFDSGCTRMENGAVTANNPTGRGMARLTCGEQFDTNFSKFITAVRERRYPVVDEERGLVYSIIFFDHAGTVTQVKLADGSTLNVPPPFDTPYTFLLGELFKIKDGKIHRVEAILLPVPFGMPSGWGK